MRGGGTRLLRSHSVSLLALFVALGGTSYAIVALPADSVGTKQVKNHSLLRKDFKPSQLQKLRGPRGRPGAVGVAGPAGAKGDKGDTGATGPSEVLVKTLGSGHIGSNSAAIIGTSVSPGPGSYLVHAQARLVNGDSTTRIIRCYIEAPGAGTVSAPTEFWLAGLGATGESIEAWSEWPVTLTDASPSVQFICQRSVSSGVDFTYTNAEITFQRVGAVTTLP